MFARGAGSHESVTDRSHTALNVPGNSGCITCQPPPGPNRVIAKEQRDCGNLFPEMPRARFATPACSLLAMTFVPLRPLRPVCLLPLVPLLDLCPGVAQRHDPVEHQPVADFCITAEIALAFELETLAGFCPGKQWLDECLPDNE